MADGKEPPFYDDHSPGPFQYKLPFYETMELFIETLTGTCFELRVSPFEAVLSVKAKIQRLEGITVAQQHLIWNNLELDDDYCLHDYGIAEGCTLKLVLAMRGGPINTRRVTVEDPMKEGPELTEGRWQQGWIGRAGAGGGAGGGGHRQVTFLLYREGDQLNFLRVVDRGDGTLTPLSEPLSAGSPLCHMCGDGEADRECRGAAQHSAENSITMSKMRLLKAKMEGMNLNKKLAKLKPRPSACPLPGPGSQGPPGAPHHHRLLPQLRPSPSANAPSSSSLLHLSPLARRAPTPFSSSSSCFMLEEEEAPWGDSGPPPPRIRKPPKVSRLDVGGGGGGSRLVRDCVYPRLHPLSRTLRPPEAAPEGPRSAGQRAPTPGDLPDPLRPGALFGALPEPLRALDVSGEARRGAAAAAAAGGGALHSLALPASPPLLSTWATGPGPSVPLPSAAASSPAVLLDRPLPQPFEFTGSPSCSSPSSSPSPTHNHPQARHAAALEPGRAPPPRPPYSVAPPPRPPYSVAPPPRPLRLRVFKVDAQGKKETRGVARLAGLACKEPPGTLSNSQLLASLAASRASAGRGEAAGPCPGSRRPSGFPPDVGRASLGSRPPATATAAGLRLFKDDLLRQMSPAHTASTSLGPGDGASTSVRRLGTPTCHLPPLKAPIGSKKKNTKHCFLCGKKTGLASSYDCRCGKNFCATHRYAEAHPCSYDYKGAGRRLLQDTHPIVSAPKLPKI